MEKRKRFFGLHFDFHADNETEIGVRTEPEDIEWYINEAEPDFIQCDCKGHPGNSSYPTKVGKAADKIVNDNLRIWCDTVHKHGIPVYMHYSGVIDEAYTKAHPEEAMREKDGKITDKACLYGEYADKYMIPQIKELIKEYDIDGIWVDGDCWGVVRDYSEKMKEYLYEGISEAEHNRIMREAFFKYAKKYVDELHNFKPDFMVTSNWMYTSYIPVKPTVEIDFISGDYPHQGSVHSARYEGRCIAAQNMPWDLMTWAWEKTHSVDKPAVQLEQEAAAVIMLGGGFQMYIHQNKDGSAKRNRSGRIGEVAEFVKKRRMLFEKKPVAQIGVLYPASAFYKKSNIFNASGATTALIGTINAVLDAQYTLNVVLEYQLDTLCQYDTVIVPEWTLICDETKKALKEYAQNCGNLMIIGADCTKEFGELCDMDFGIIEERDQAWILDDNGSFCGITPSVSEENIKKRLCRILDIKTGDDVLYENSDLRDKYLPAYRIDDYGKGKIAWIPFDFGTDYMGQRTYIHVNFIKKILYKLAKPVIEVNRKRIDLSMQESENGLIVNLLNMNQGRHTYDILVYDEIDEIHDVEVIVHEKFGKVSMPLGEDFEYESGEDYTKISLKRLDIHSIILLEK